MKRTLLRGARVVSMVPNRPDSEHLDILIEGDRITDVGVHSEPRVDNVVDLRDRIIIPGLINAHLHSWQGALRCAGSDWTLVQYLTRVHGIAAPRYTPEDMRIGALAAALNQINCGTTTLGDWCHNNPSPDHTDGALAGILQSGIRAVFFYGAPATPHDSVQPLAEVDRLLTGSACRQSLLTLGMAIRGPQYSAPQAAVGDFRSAEERGLTVSMHQSTAGPTASWDAVRREKLLGPRTNVVHGVGLDGDWIRVLVDAGASFTTTPENELCQGHGWPITGSLLEVGAAPSLGTDVDAVVPGEVLTAARIALAHQRAVNHEAHRRSTGTMAEAPSITGKQALSWATVEGARALGLADRVGRIEPGMQADIVVIDARALNLWPARDPIGAVLNASIANVEAVMIAGDWRKRDHALVDVDLDSVRSALQESMERVLAT